MQHSASALTRLRPALTNPIRWELIEQQYDLMMKYATAIRLGTASTEAIPRRFSSDVTHPAYAAILEVGRAQRTIFIAGYLHDRDLQREINAGLNVVKNGAPRPAAMRPRMSTTTTRATSWAQPR